MPTKRTPIGRPSRRRITPEAIAAFIAGDEAALSRALRLRPWEFPGPLDVEDGEECPYPAGTGGAEWWTQLMALRRELTAAGATKC